MNRKGFSIKNAIKIIASNTDEGINSEYNYIDSQYDNWELLNQSVIFSEGKKYDRMYIKINFFFRRSIFFDISSFYGKR